MSRHRNVRALRYSDEYDYDDVYGHSVEDDHSISPTEESFLYDRSKKTQIGSFLGTSVEEEAEEEKTPAEPSVPVLSDLEEAQLRSCLDTIHDIVGDSVPDNFLVEAIVKHQFDVDRSLDAILNSGTSSNVPVDAPKPQRRMAQENKPAALSSAFASLLKNATSNTRPPKPIFGACEKTMKPTIPLLKQKHETPVSDSSSHSQVTPSAVSASTQQSSPFANLLSKKKDIKQPSFGSSSLEKISAQYLSNVHNLTPKFGSASGKSGISCPVFVRDESASVVTPENEIRPLSFSKEIQIPSGNSKPYNSEDTYSTSAGSGSEFGSPSSKFTFSPIPNKTQSSCIATSPQDKQSSLAKLKDRHVRNTRAEKSQIFVDGFPSPNSDDRSKRFNFDLSSALVTRNPETHVPTDGNNKILIPLQQQQIHTIVVDQLACVSDARSLLHKSSHNRKRLSAMGKVICKKWKPGTCENIVLQYKPAAHIPAFKFDTMSPDDEILSKFKRRR